MGERGEGSLSYLTVILLIGAVLAAVTVVAIPHKIVSGVQRGICLVVQDDDCRDGAGQPAAATSPTPSSGTTPTSPPVSSPASPAIIPAGETPAERERREALAAATKADQDAQGVENEWTNFDLLKEIAKLGLDFLAGDIINCIKKPNFSDCAWALLDVVPWGKIGKLLKAIPKVAKLVDRFLDLKRRLDKARQARKDAKDRVDRANEACKLEDKKPPNSFVRGTPVLMADGTRKPIERVRPGDHVWATDPETGRAGAREVTDLISGAGHKRLVDLTIDLDGSIGGPSAVLRATADHPFWVPGAADWIQGGRLVPGDMLTTPDGRRAMVLEGRRHERVERVYNLTVDDLHTYYVAAGGTDLLVHNCRDLDRHEEPEPPPRVADPLKQGHTLKDHVDASDARLQEHARRNGVAGRWIDRQTAEQAIDYALANNKAKIDNWLAGKGPSAGGNLTLDGQFGPNGGQSLGDVMYPDGRKVPAGVKYRVVLKRSKGHKPGWYVYTAYPLP